MGKSKEQRTQEAQEKREAVAEWKLRVGCERCSTRLGRLVFHHPDPKAFSLRIGESYGLPWNRLIDEIVICEILCDLCHMQGHHGSDD